MSRKERIFYEKNMKDVHNQSLAKIFLARQIALERGTSKISEKKKSL